MSGGTVAGLFAGIGGLELGLGSEWSTELLCEIGPGASAVGPHRLGAPAPPGVGTSDDAPTSSACESEGLVPLLQATWFWPVAQASWDRQGASMHLLEAVPQHRTVDRV